METGTIITLGALLVTTILSLLGLRNKNNRDTITDLKFKVNAITKENDYNKQKILELERENLNLMQKLLHNDNRD